MKKLILAVTLSAFALGAHAGESCADKAKSGCADKAAAGCPASKKDAAKCPDGGDTAKKKDSEKPAESAKGSQAKK